MKKHSIITTLLVATSVLTMSTTAYAGISLNNNKTAETEAPSISEEAVEVTEWEYVDGINQKHTFLIITNHNDYPINAKAVGYAYDAAGDLKEENKFNNIHAVGPEEQSIIEIRYGHADEIDRTEYTIEYELSDPYYYSPILSDLEVTGDINDDQVVLAIKNNSEYAGHGVIAYVLFKNESGDIVFSRSVNFWDMNLELKPGFTMYESTDCSEDYSDLEIYLQGAGSGTGYEGPALDDTQVPKKEYRYNMGNTTYTYQVVTNTTDDVINIWSNAVVKGEDGTLLWAENSGCNTIGPDETSIIVYRFIGMSSDYSDIEYQYLYEVEEDYIPISSQLAVEEKSAADGLDVTVTNNSDYDAQDCEVYVLFLDADGNVVKAGNEYYENDDYDFPAGTSLTETFVVPEAYDHYEIYVRAFGEDD